MTKRRKIEYLTSSILVLILFIILNLAISSGLINRYISGVIIMICINIILAVSLNVTVGVLGQINLGHAGFMSVGAYSAALFAKSGILDGLANYFVSIGIGAIVALLLGILVGIPCLRLKGDYLAIITLAFGEIIRVLIEFFDFTGGAQGLTSIPVTKSFPLTYILMVVSITIMYSLMTSRHGRSVLSIREDEIASEACGVNTTKVKVFAFAVSAMFAGVAGAIYGQYMGLLTAKQFSYTYSVDILVMVVLGGMGSFTGSILSALGLTLLPELLRGAAGYRMIIYPIILIAVMLYHPSGLFGRKEFQISKFLEKFLIKFGKKLPDDDINRLNPKEEQ